MSTPDQLGFSFQAPPRRTWTVRELVGSVRAKVEREYIDVWVEGEISNFRPADSGHMYFTIKDGDAQLNVVMFRLQARLLRFRPENGLQIMARGRITIYESRGQLQLVAEYLEPKGAGSLQIAFEQLKAKLAAEGLFDVGRKRPIPALPRCIGIVTSPRGAAIQDMLNILRRRHRDVSVLIYPAQVQGESAAGEIVSGIRYFNHAGNVEVVILARGGGSLEDLAAFNDESLARAIAGSGIPVISAVGHETDFTIADFVADMRAPTPSAAAELVVETKHQLEERVAMLRQRLARAIRYRLLVSRQQWTELSQHGVFARMQEFIARRQQRLDEVVYRLGEVQRVNLQRLRRRLDVAGTRLRHHDLGRVLSLLRQAFGSTTARMETAAEHMLQSQRLCWQALDLHLKALSPLSILERGYALVFDTSGSLIKDASQLEPGDEVQARLARGSIAATINSIQAGME